MKTNTGIRKLSIGAVVRIKNEEYSICWARSMTSVKRLKSPPSSA